MNLRRLAALATIFALSGAIAYRAGSAAQAPKKTDQESVAVRCARAQLRLAEITLQKANDLNRKVAQTIPSAMVAQFADDVEIAKARVQSAERAGGVDAFQAWLRRAEVELRSAETKLKQATEISQRAPGMYQPIDLERFRVGVDVARLQLERGKSLAGGPADAKLQWQLEMLNDGLARLKEQTWLIVQNRGPLEF
jgi:hypothetical protein